MLLLLSSTPSLNTNLRVATRVYDVEGGAIFSKNSTFVFFDGAVWTPRLRSPSPIMAPVKKNKFLAVIRATRDVIKKKPRSSGDENGSMGFQKVSVFVLYNACATE